MAKIYLENNTIHLEKKDGSTDQIPKSAARYKESTTSFHFKDYEDIRKATTIISFDDISNEVWTDNAGSPVPYTEATMRTFLSTNCGS